MGRFCRVSTRTIYASQIHFFFHFLKNGMQVATYQICFLVCSRRFFAGEYREERLVKIRERFSSKFLVIKPFQGRLSVVKQKPK